VASPARELLRRLVQNDRFGFYGCISDNLDVGEKVTRIWAKTKGTATAIDHVLVFSDTEPDMYFEWLKKSGIPGLSDNHINLETMMVGAEEIRGCDIYDKSNRKSDRTVTVSE